ncbi:MAG: hypothetical protein BroJett042_00570 [Bacteroidota bacterium]|nr:MAG: hypothetical protein BroJett042_00570 [Bacteroidota bacterium]
MKKLGLCILILIIINSCVSIHENFSLFESSPSINGKSELKIHGIYIRDEAERTNQYNYLYLFEDGSVLFGSNLIASTDKDFFLDERHKLIETKGYESANGYFNDNLAGHFTLKGDSIFIQYFITQYQQFILRNSIDVFGVITKDSNIVLIRKECSWCNKKYYQGGGSDINKKYDPPIAYRFYETSTKPDSSRIWFKRKRWYKKNVWYNQK